MHLHEQCRHTGISSADMMFLTFSMVRLNNVQHTHILQYDATNGRTICGKSQSDVRYRVSDEMSGEWITVCDLG